MEAKIPKQDKAFSLEIHYNSHPLRMNLKRRGMDIDTRCDVCYRFDEDGAHLFFKCKITEERWDTLGLS